MNPKFVFTRSTIIAALYIFLATGIGDAIAQGQTSFTTISSSQFFLKDTNGQYRGEMTVDGHGRTLIILADGQGRTALTLGVERNGTAFIHDATGRPFVSAQTRQKLYLPATERVPRPSSSTSSMTGKGDAADIEDTIELRKQLDALWGQMRILQKRIDLISGKI